MPRRSRAALLFLAIILTGLITVTGCYSSFKPASSEGNLPPSPNIGHPAPDFTLTDLEGNRVRLSDYRGKAVFLNFWATWCPACREEMPDIEAVYQKYKDKDAIIIGIDIMESKAEVLSFVQENGYSWPFVLDTTGEVANRYRVTALPTSFFLDGEGIIRTINIGAMSQQAMEGRLNSAMR